MYNLYTEQLFFKESSDGLLEIKDIAAEMPVATCLLDKHSMFHMPFKSCSSCVIAIHWELDVKQTLIPLNNPQIHLLDRVNLLH